MPSYPTNPVQYGQSSSAVKQLQEFLISQGYSIPAGATGNFFDQTKSALAQWQSANGISSSTPGYGTNWGPQSISKASSGGSSYNQPAQQNQQAAYNPPVQYNAPSTNSNQAQIDAITKQIAGIQKQTSALQQYGLTDTNQLTQDSSGNWVPKNNAQTVNPNQAEIDRITKQIAETQKITSALQQYGLTDTNQLMQDANGNWIPTISATNPKDTTGVTPAAPTLKPQLVPGTPEYQAALDKLSTAYYDVMQTALTADTEGQQIAAQTAWNQLKDYTAATLGINLSDDATKAWDQIQGIKNQASVGGQNITGSGMQQESIDSYLRNVRSADKANRLTSKNTQDNAQAKYYQGFASPEQVKALIDSNPSLAQSYGLIPSEDTKSKMSYAALKAKYPDMKDEDINAQIATVLDENGNRRSNLYQTYMTGKVASTGPAQETPIWSSYDPVTGKGIGSIIGYNVEPTDYGMMDIAQAKKQYQNRNAPLGNAVETSGSSILTTGPGSIIGTGANNTTPAPATPTYTAPVTPPVATPAPIVVPQGLTSSGQGTASTPNAPTSQPSTYKVQEGDTLYGLYGADWERLSGYKGDPKKLQIGAVLPMPPSKALKTMSGT
jgi:hypothetical protein